MHQGCPQRCGSFLAACCPGWRGAVSGQSGHGVVVVLSIAKISNGDYYLKAVANGIEDYYALGEAPGRWTGHSTELLGLEGEIQPEQLTAVLAGRNPINCEVLIDSANRTVPAFDLTFRAPKSVSLIFGLGPAGHG